MLRNIAINIQATGPAAVLIAWLLCFTALALWGTSALTAYAQGVLGAFGVFLLSAIGQNVK